MGRKVMEFGKAFLRDIPRSGASLEMKAIGMEEMTPETRAEKFLFGKEPIKIPEETGADTLRGFGVGEEGAKRWGGAVGYPLAVLGVNPFFSGKKKAAKGLAKKRAKGIKEVKPEVKPFVQAVGKPSARARSFFDISTSVPDISSGRIGNQIKDSLSKIQARDLSFVTRRIEPLDTKYLNFDSFLNIAKSLYQKTKK